MDFDSIFADLPRMDNGQSPPNPYYQGQRIVDRDDLFPQGWSSVDLDTIYARLTADSHDAGLILESPDMAELEFYHPGSESVPDEYILEAITVEHFSRTERRMAAVVKVFNRHLKETEIKALAPIVGKPRKSGAFAYVIVQLPFSDGQSVNVVFHSPEGDKKKITAADTIIAFRWLLNKRDITHVVAPENGEEVTLETIAKRVTQLVVKNSARFEKQQKAAQEERKELETAREALKDAEQRQAALMDATAAAIKHAEGLEARLSNVLARLEKQRAVNAELAARLAALQKSRARPEPDTPTAEGQEGAPQGTDGPDAATARDTPETPAYIAAIEDILAGKYDSDTGKILDLLDQAIAQAEQDGTLAQYEALLNTASNRLTDLLAKEAA